MTVPLQGRSVLVTGGGSGLGRSLVEQFRARGAFVGVLDADAARVGELTQLLGEDGVAVHGDVRTSESNRAAAAAVVERTGRLDSFVGVAGINDFSAGFSQLTPDQAEAAFDEVMAVNTKGYLLGCLAALPALRESRGSIVLTLSPAAFQPGSGGPAYTVSKHAALGLVRQLAYECAPDVRVNGVAPGAIARSDLRGPVSLAQSERSLAELPVEKMARSSTPLRESAETNDSYAALYALLIGGQSPGVTGSIFRWDQGFTLVGPGVRPEEDRHG